MVLSWIMSTLCILGLLFKFCQIYFLQVLNFASAYDRSKQKNLCMCVCVCVGSWGPAEPLCYASDSPLQTSLLVCFVILFVVISKETAEGHIVMSPTHHFKHLILIGTLSHIVVSLTHHCTHLILIGMFCCSVCSDSWGSSWGAGEPHCRVSDSPLRAPDPYWYVLLFSFSTHLMNIV